MSGSSTDPGSRSSAEIERDVERTRASVAGTLDELRNRLNPSQLVDQAVDQARDYLRGSGGTDFVRNLGGALRDNPLPVALIGTGIAWLLLSGGRGASSSSAAPDRADPGPRLLPAPSHASGSSSDGSVTDSEARVAASARTRVSAALDSAGESVGQAASAVGDAASGAVDAVSGAASRLADGVGGAVQAVASLGSSTAERTGDGLGAAGDRITSAAQEGLRGLDRLANAQPLLFGALGLAVGAVLGAVLPRTQAEDELMGEARDALAGRVGESVRESVEEVRAVAGEGLGQAGAALAEGYAAAKDGLSGGDPSKVADAVKGAVANVAEATQGALHGAAERTKEGMRASGGQAPTL
jgi:hypothetical protein